MVCWNPMEINPSIFRAYDVRGRYPREINESVVAAISRAYAAFVKPRTVVIGRDVRLSGPVLARAAVRALRQSGVNIIDIGVMPTDALYFAVVKFRADGGVFISASHNPRQWNGMNFSRRGAAPITSDSGLLDIQRLATADVSRPSPRQGKLVRRDITGPYLKFVAGLSSLKRPRPLTIVLNANFGVSARLFRALARRQRYPFRILGINDWPDGRFPKGPPDPLLPANRHETIRRIRQAGADLGIAWDADGDRCFFFDEQGGFVSGYFVTALLAAEMLKRRPGAKILTDPRLVWATADAVRQANGHLIITKTGFAFIPERMAKERAAFAGEMSGHYYFPDTFNRDNGFLPALMLIDLMSRTGRRLSEIAAPLRTRYAILEGELNFPIHDKRRARAVLARARTACRGGRVSRVEGLSIEYPRWRFNLRPSHTEPLLRLNVEARDRKTLHSRARWLSRIIRAS